MHSGTLGTAWLYRQFWGQSKIVWMRLSLGLERHNSKTEYDTQIGSKSHGRAYIRQDVFESHARRVSTICPETICDKNDIDGGKEEESPGTFCSCLRLQITRCIRMLAQFRIFQTLVLPSRPLNTTSRRCDSRTSLIPRPRKNRAPS